VLFRQHSSCSSDDKLICCHKFVTEVRFVGFIVLSFAAGGFTMASIAAEPPLQQRKTEMIDARQQFLKVFDEIREEVLADPMLVQKDASEWMARMLDYNVPGGKLNRGMAVKETLMMIMPDASKELQKKADCVGWSIEFLQVLSLQGTAHGKHEQ
jgi:Polyprenyl synthetase